MKAKDVKLLDSLSNGEETDLSRLRKAEAIVRQMLDHEHEINIHKSQLIAFMSHQFRNPMTSILLAAEALVKVSEREEGPILVQKVLQYAQQTRQEIYRLDRLMNKVLLQERNSLLNDVPQWENIELVTFCRDLIKHLCQQDYVYQRVIFRSELEEAVINVDSIILEHILENLLNNAIKYSSETDKAVEISLKRLVDKIQITIKDYGIGIPEAEIQYVGRAFFRASNTSSISGIGIGLSLSHQFLKQHGGRLEIESQLGQYTLCTILLPLQEKAIQFTSEVSPCYLSNQPQSGT